MKAHKYSKGEYGFLHHKKCMQILLCSVLAFLVVAIFVTGLILNKTRNNIFTVLAILLVLPMAKILVNVIMLMRFKSTPYKTYEMLLHYEDNNNILYDMPLSTPEEIFFAPIILIKDKEVFFYVENKLKDKDKCEKYIQGFARNDGIIIKAKIINDKNQILRFMENGNKSEKDISGIVNILSILHI